MCANLGLKVNMRTVRFCKIFSGLSTDTPADPQTEIPLVTGLSVSAI